MKKLALIGDYDPSNTILLNTENAVIHATSVLGLGIQKEWVNTSEINSRFSSLATDFAGFWIAPGSPYKDMEAVLKLINYARTHYIPTFGTCGGFQHMVIEYARNVMNIEDARHAEYDPYASTLVVNPLSCDLKGEPMEVHLTNTDSKVYRAYQTEIIKERYFCNFGLNPEYQSELDNLGLKVVASDSLKEARIVELEKHPFFIATLFVPQDRSTPQNPHPLVMAFISKIAGI